MHKLLFFFLTLFIFSSGFSQRVIKDEQLPSFVINHPTSDKEIISDYSYQYFLYDLQISLKSELEHSHFALKLLNAEGVQNNSTITIDFDPSYQKLTIHSIRVIRDDQIHDKLRESEIQEIQREKQMESAIYDGSITALINLSDVQVNDVIEYSYTIKGFNPVNNKTFSRFLNQEFNVPINQLLYRVILNHDQPLIYKTYNDAKPPRIINLNGNKEYIWELSAKQPIIYDVNTPSWYIHHKRVALSTFSGWAEVVDWAIPLFKFDEVQTPNIELKSKSEESKINEIVKFVQQEVRYLGLESGIGAYQPHPPNEVFNQRYGDCKDKSLLLVALLRKEGVAAYPMLVSSSYLHAISDFLPSNNAFDHCVVTFNYYGLDYYIDPTSTYQGGSFDQQYFPNYKKGLVIKEGVNSLRDLPINSLRGIEIEERIKSEEVGGEASLLIKSIYSGGSADDIRYEFQTNSIENIQKEYLTFYSRIYPSIEVNKKVTFKDFELEGKNEFIVEESYVIPDFWILSDDGSTYKAETDPIVVKSNINHPSSPQREMPYLLGAPKRITQTTIMELPKDWDMDDYTFERDSEHFSYYRSLKSNGNKVIAIHDYQLYSSYLESEEVAKFLKDHNDLLGQMLSYVQIDAENSKSAVSASSGFKLKALLIVLISLLIAALMVYLIYTRFDPFARSNYGPSKIGGWLILPAIGLSLAPFILSFSILQLDIFAESTWEYASQAEISFFYSLEIMYNILLLAFSILIAVLFFQRRTSVPLLITIYYLLNLFVPMIDHLIIESYIPNFNQFSDDPNEIYRDTIRSAILAIIWIPYFWLSERSKDTFMVRLKSKDEFDEDFSLTNNSEVNSNLKDRNPQDFEHNPS